MVSTFGLAADVVGKWSGKIEIEVDKATQAKMGGAAPKSPGLTLELRSDKTYKGTQSGNPDGKDRTSEGKWKLEGNTLTLSPLKRDGKPATGDGAKPRTYVLSKDGKTLTMDLTSQVRASAKNAAGKAEIPKFKAKMVLKRNK